MISPCSCSSSSNIALIFFQAEDGIRDIGVTGVQTCALPIYDRLRHAHVLSVRATKELQRRGVAPHSQHARMHDPASAVSVFGRRPLPDIPLSADRKSVV